jgi:hypothetical protein
MDVVHGGHFLTPLLVRIMKLPERGANIPVVLRVTNEQQTARPHRPDDGVASSDRGDHPRTRQFALDGGLVEQSGPGRVDFSLQADSHGSLHYSDVACFSRCWLISQSSAGAGFGSRQ